MNKKHIIISFIGGIVLAVFSYHAYLVYSLKAEVDQDHAVLAQIVALINQTQSKTPTQ